VSESSIEISVFQRVPEELREAARTLARASFKDPGETDEQRAERHDRFSSHDDIIKQILALNDGEFVGLAVAFRRTVEIGGRPAVLGGIGDVCVAPEHRRQGIATRLTRAALHELDLAECDVAYLCAEVHKPGLPTLYGRLGFVPLSRGHTYLGASGRRYVDHDGMLAPVRSRELFEAILQQREPFDIGQGNW
jgi:predicted N-acetyltransferase YhbS